jgi:hypothetical protein
MSENTNDYLNYILKLTGASNINKKISKCGKFAYEYDKCIDDGHVFENCYSLYYEKFLQCCKEVDLKNINKTE